MKKLSVKKDVPCMACLECVRACSTTYFKEFNPDKSFIKITANGTGAKPVVCLQCGKCMRTCEFDAISQNPKTGVFMINKKKCTGCGKCVEACPMHVMVPEENGPTSKCIACGICAKSCPMEVLEIIEK
jgi:ferredoxin